MIHDLVLHGSASATFVNIFSQTFPSIGRSSSQRCVVYRENLPGCFEDNAYHQVPSKFSSFEIQGSSLIKLFNSHFPVKTLSNEAFQHPRPQDTSPLQPFNNHLPSRFSTYKHSNTQGPQDASLRPFNSLLPLKTFNNWHYIPRSKATKLRHLLSPLTAIRPSRCLTSQASQHSRSPRYFSNGDFRPTVSTQGAHHPLYEGAP
ncbi:unnamed protein product [Closterium sp. Yama58-4]|nr:unnamed protein product [Closterium sp. Yama58-4]